jgi:hypothetical protein
MQSNCWDKKYIGFIAGMIGPVIGFHIFYILRFYDKAFSEYLTMFIEIDEFKSPVLSLSIIFNFILLFYFLNRDKYQAGWGVLFATFVYVPVIVYYYLRYNL